MTRIVIVSHSHPALRYGGGEVAAYRQFKHLLAEGEDVYFLGSSIGPEDSARFFGPAQRVLSFSKRDFCLRGLGMDAFVMEHPLIATEDWLLDFLLALEGDVYHFHHFWNIGAGTLRRLRAARPQAQMICTLHEMTAICANHGQMVKTSGELCHAASEVACSACLGRAPAEFVLRRARMVEMLNLFDILLAPSLFMANRFYEWGIASHRISVIENGLDYEDSVSPQSEVQLAFRSRRFAYFGQATPTKGLDVLIRAAKIIDLQIRSNTSLLPDTLNPVPAADKLTSRLSSAIAFPSETVTPASISLEVYGVTAEGFALLWPDLIPPKWVHFKGRYRPEDCISIMRRFGWIIIPSVWWENSPVVIQEARAAGTPMIASDIGGMAEKTEDWGIQFSTGDPDALATAILSVHNRPDVLVDHINRIRPPLDMKGFTDEWRRALKTD